MPQTTTESKLLDAETRRSVTLKRLIRTVNAVVTESPVTIDRDGIRFHATDPSMVAMIDLQLTPAFFTQYHLAPDQPVQFDVDVDDVKNRVCEARKGDTVGLAVTDSSAGAEHQVHVTVDDAVDEFIVDASREVYSDATRDRGTVDRVLRIGARGAVERQRRAFELAFISGGTEDGHR